MSKPHGFGDTSVPGINEDQVTNEIPKVDYARYLEFVDEVTSQESKDYDAFQERIDALKTKGCDVQRLMTAATGLSAEAGEFTEIVKKIVFQGKPYSVDNIDHMKTELGDCLWYIAQACMALGTSFDELALMNVNKLVSRYPEGQFNVMRSENRKAGDR